MSNVGVCACGDDAAVFVEVEWFFDVFDFFETVLVGKVLSEVKTVSLSADVEVVLSTGVVLSGGVCSRCSDDVSALVVIVVVVVVVVVGWFFDVFDFFETVLVSYSYLFNGNCKLK